VLAVIDHNDLNQVLENPTAENVVIWMWGRLRDHVPGLKELQLWETDDSAVIYRGEAVAALAEEAAPR
jgi:6-pyruvoyltetrahydropterin/6-carboxytetrahydropterin synthase